MHNIMNVKRAVDLAEFLGINLKIARENKGLNQKDLADQVGVDQSTVSRWENEKQYPPTECYGKLTKILEVPADFFSREWAPPFAPYNIDDVLGEWQTIKKRLEALEGQVDISKPLPLTPVSRFSSLLRDADLTTLYACLYLLSGSKEDLEMVDRAIRDEVVVLRKHLRPLRPSNE